MRFIDSVQLSSVTQSYPILCNPMNRSTPGLPVHHQFPESTQTHVHRVGDAIQPSQPLLSPSSPALNLSQHQGLFKWVSSSHQVAKILEFQLQHQSYQWPPGLISFRMDWLNLLAVQGGLSIDFYQIIEIRDTSNSIQSRVNLVSLDSPTNHPAKSQILKQFSFKSPILRHHMVCVFFLIAGSTKPSSMTGVFIWLIFAWRALTVPPKYLLNRWRKKGNIILWI